MFKKTIGKKLIGICCALAMLMSGMAVSAESAVITTTPEDGATGIGSETTVTVATNGVEIDFGSLGADSVAVSGGSAAVGEISYDELNDPYKYSFSLSGLSRRTTYTVSVKVPLMTSDIPAEKIAIAAPMAIKPKLLLVSAKTANAFCRNPISIPPVGCFLIPYSFKGSPRATCFSVPMESSSGISCEIQTALSEEKTRVWMNPENKPK